MQMLYNKFLLFLTVFLFMISPIFSQTPADIDSLLGEAEINGEQAAYFTLALALEKIPENPQAAFSLAREKGWLAADMQNTGKIDYSGLSFLLMNAFNIKGGMMYRFTGSPRYAYRELKNRGIINGRVYSDFPVSGEHFLQILGNITDDEGGAW